KAGANNMNATVIGTWPDYATVRNSEVELGAFFTNADLDLRNRVAVLGFEIATTLFPGQDPLGQTVTINRQSYEVLGVLPDKGASGFSSPNRQVLVPLSTYLQRIGRQAAVGDQTVQSIIVQGARANQLSALQADL